MRPETAFRVVALVAAMLIVVIAWDKPKPSAGEDSMASEHNSVPTPEQIAELPPDGGAEFNRLVHERSPYLLQHARNPVDWYPWGPEALARAKAEDKPIFLSVGYSTCHWCHVMERESFERDDVAAILNEHYVAIKVDREERPDVDQIYMLATQMLTGRGGWPNSLWLSPDGSPWYAGTYFPREDAPGRPGFKTILTHLAEAWKTRRKDVDDQAARIAEAMAGYAAGTHAKPEGKLSHELLIRATGALRQTFDSDLGGFGQAPKFPPHAALRLLFHEYRHKNDKALLDMATATLDAMARGGIHDHVGGGFHRYSTDDRWFLPHFEKMLYDNAQLARAYVDAHLLTGDEAYRTVAADIYDWAIREMTDSAGGFHSALDADSEGEEGKFYLWSREQVIEVLGKEEGTLFCDVYGMAEGGNYRDEATGRTSGTSIPHLPEPIAEAARELRMPATELATRMATARRKLLVKRNERVWPHLDDKVLTSWNALMIGSLAYGGQHLKRPEYVDAAETAADFVLNDMRQNGRLLRTYRQGEAKLNAYLDDYAFLADALIDLYEATGEKRWLAEAQAIAQGMIEHFADPSSGAFYFTANDHEELLTRIVDPMDQSIPSGNAVAAGVLVRLGRHTGRREYLDAARKTLDNFVGFMEQMPAQTASLLLVAGMYLDSAGPAPARGPVTVEASTSSLAVRAGQTVDLTVRIDVPGGWHINSNRPLQENLIPTTIAVAGDAAAALGDVVYPPGRSVKFEFSPEPVSVYEATVLIHAKLRIPADARPGPWPLDLAVKTQACNDTSCLAPETHRLSLPFKVGSPDPQP